MKIERGRRIGVLVLFFGLMVGSAACRKSLTTVDVEQSDDSARIRTLSLGDYVTGVSGIEIFAPDNQPVWKVVAHNGSAFQINGFSLVPGANRSDLLSSSTKGADIVVPKTPEFFLERGKTYRIEIFVPEKRELTVTFKARNASPN